MTHNELKERLVKLQQFESNLARLVASLSSLYVARKPDQLKQLTSAMTFVDKLRGLKISNTRPLLDACANELVSLREGVFIGAAVDKKALQVITCADALAQIQDRIKRLEAKIETSAADPELQIDDLMDISRQTILKNLALKNKLPKIGDKPFTVGRAPVVVVTHAEQVKHRNNPAAFIDIAKLDRLGFSVDRIDGYAVLNNQLVVGMAVKNLPKKVTSKDALESVLGSLEKAMKRKLTVVVPKGFPHAGAIWYWIMSEKESSRFSKAFPGGRIKLNEWGFAFDSSHAKHEEQYQSMQDKHKGREESWVRPKDETKEWRRLPV